MSPLFTPTHELKSLANTFVDYSFFYIYIYVYFTEEIDNNIKVGFYIWRTIIMNVGEINSAKAIHLETDTINRVI